MKLMTFVVTLIIGLFGCAAPRPEITESVAPAPNLEVFAESDRQWTGVAVAEDGRVFVNFPRWWPETPVSVAEVLSDGGIRPYPDESWNAWSPGDDPQGRFVCVQSVIADEQGSLWVLDPGNPWFQGVVSGAARLIEVDLATDRVVRVIQFDESVAPAGSYLNDVRIDHAHEVAYITESGAGALVIVDLNTGGSRRLLDDDPSTSAENTVLTIEGSQWRMPDGTAPQVHADGIAYDPATDFVYYQALTGRTLYRISAAALRDPTLEREALASRVEKVSESGPSDGLLWDDADGIFISAIEDDAVKRWSAAGGVGIVIQDPRLAWPDSFAFGPEGALYVTTSQIHRGPNPPEPYRILRITGF